jgi:rare lipoprotein A
MSGAVSAKGGWQSGQGMRERLRRCPRISTPGLWLLGLLALGALAGCGSNPKYGDGHTPGAVPKVEPKSRYGNMKSYEVFGQRYVTKASSRGHVERGQASWYGKKFHGRKTSSGERYDMYQMTAAHKTLPLPTYALVTNLENGRSTVVKVNDRGPFVGTRIIDLSYAAAKRLDMIHAGTAMVEVRSIDPRDHGGKVKVPLRMASASATPKVASASERRADEASAEATGRGSAAKSASPTPTLASSSARPVYLQVGAFGSRGNALQLQTQLSGAVDQPVLVRTASTAAASDPLYKVQVGPLSSEADADALGRRLAALGIATPVVVTP